MKLERLRNITDPSPRSRRLKFAATEAGRNQATIQSQVRGAWWASVGGQVALIVLLVLIWPVPIINPIKLIVVLLHELSHVLTAWATGGIVFGIAIHPAGAGATLGMGGNEFLIVLAGYVGSFLIGVALYLALMRLEPDEIWALLGILCGLSLVFQWLNSFTALFGYGALILIAAGTFMIHPNIKEVLIRLVATASCLYPLFDIGGELFFSRRTGFIYEGRLASSDLALLTVHTGIPEWIIAVVFLSTGLVAVTLLIGSTARHYAQDRLRVLSPDPRRRRGVDRSKWDSDQGQSERRYNIP